MTQPNRWHGSATDRLALGLIAVFMLPAGLQAAFAPRSFFDDFPVGRGWISHQTDAYNEHLVRDVGTLFLAMIIVTVWTVLRRLPTRSVAIAWLVQGILHLAYHTRHLDGYATADIIGLVGSLVIVPALALVATWAGRARRSRPPKPRHRKYPSEPRWPRQHDGHTETSTVKVRNRHDSTTSTSGWLWRSANAAGAAR